jgi:hypothetical protein
MNAEALPLTLLLLLTEFSVGGLWVLWLWDLRGKCAPSFIKFGAWLTMAAAGLTLWVSLAVSVGDEVDGYPLDASFMGPARVALGSFFVLALLYAALVLWPRRRWTTLAAGAAGSVAGLASVALLAQVFAPPTWGYPAALLSLLAGGLVVGAVSMGMVLGHWYLVTPRLAEAPLREMTAFLVAAMALDGLLVALALALPREAIPSDVDTPLVQNPFFWLRVGGGLVFPMLLAYMAYESSKLRAMQSATGLLYIAMTLVLAGEVLGKGLLFVSAVPN